MSWGALFSLGVGSISYMGDMKAASAAYAASGRQAAELRIRAEARRSLILRQTHNLFKNFSSAEADFLNKKGDEKELMLMNIDKVISQATSSLGTSGVKLSEGTPKSLITQLRLEGAEALIRQEQDVTNTQVRMETSYESQRDEMKTQGEAEAKSMERTAVNIDKSRADQLSASKYGAFASFLGSTLQTSAALDLGAEDWKFGFGGDSGSSLSKWDYNPRQPSAFMGSSLSPTKNVGFMGSSLDPNFNRPKYLSQPNSMFNSYGMSRRSLLTTKRRGGQ